MDSPDFPTEKEAQENQEKDINTMKDFLNNFFWFSMGAFGMFVIILILGLYT